MILKSLVGFVGNLFSSNKASDTIIDIVRDKTGVNELKPKEKVDALITYLDKTKHQSLTRRALALATMFGVMLFTGTWLFTGFIESFYVFILTDTTSVSTASTSSNIAKIAIQPLTQFRNNIITMLKEVLQQPFSIVFGFYFGSQLISTLKRDK